MEKFSKFFDSIVSGKSSGIDATDNSSASINNDNSIYNNSNNIYSENFPIEDYYLLSNEIILGAIKLHKKLYDSNTISYYFIAYYFKVFGQIKSPRSNYLNHFLILFHNKKNNVANAIAIFQKSYKKQSEIKHINKSSIFSGLKQGYYLDVASSLNKFEINYSPNIDINLKTAISDTRSFISEIEYSVKTSGFKSNYLDFLSNSGNEQYSQVSLKTSPKTPKIEPKRVIAPPKQEKEQRISTIAIPKLSTGKIFPTSFTHSRIDSAHFASKFLEGDQTYKLIKKYKFIKVKYNEGFETKRKELFTPPKSSFDLF